MKMQKKILISVLVTLALVYGGIVQANTITGDLWHVSEATSQNAVVGNVPGPPGSGDVTFSVNTPLNFSATSATVGAWLASGGASSVVEHTVGTLASPMDNLTTGTLVSFTGFVTVTTGQTFTVGHDDGLTLIIGGFDLGFNPGPSAFVSSLETYSGLPGNQPFTLVYGECCGGPAVLQIDLPFSEAVPEPATILLLGSGLVGLWVISKRFKK